jgi:hypothetical protein
LCSIFNGSDNGFLSKGTNMSLSAISPPATTAPGGLTAVDAADRQENQPAPPEPRVERRIAFQVEGLKYDEPADVRLRRIKTLAALWDEAAQPAEGKCIPETGVGKKFRSLLLHQSRSGMPLVPDSAFRRAAPLDVGREVQGQPRALDMAEGYFHRRPASKDAILFASPHKRAYDAAMAELRPVRNPLSEIFDNVLGLWKNTDIPENRFATPEEIDRRMYRGTAWEDVFAHSACLKDERELNTVQMFLQWFVDIPDERKAEFASAMGDSFAALMRAIPGFKTDLIKKKAFNDIIGQRQYMTEQQRLDVSGAYSAIEGTLSDDLKDKWVEQQTRSGAVQAAQEDAQRPGGEGSRRSDDIIEG